jgi:hypothetical protein
MSGTTLVKDGRIIGIILWPLFLPEATVLAVIKSMLMLKASATSVVSRFYGQILLPLLQAKSVLLASTSIPTSKPTAIPAIAFCRGLMLQRPESSLQEILEKIRNH